MESITDLKEKENNRNFLKEDVGNFKYKIIKYSSGLMEIIKVKDVGDMYEGIRKSDKFTNSYKGFRSIEELEKDIKERIKRNQNFSNRRAAAMIKKLILENELCYHYGTTYKEDLENQRGLIRSEVIKDNILFIKRLSFQTKNKIKCVEVPEIHKKRYIRTGLKIIHMHIAIGDYIDERVFYSAWNTFKCLTCDLYKYRNIKGKFRCGDCGDFKGLTWLRKGDILHVEKTANYFKKYFQKGFEEEDLNQRETIGQKRYFRSRGLKMPEEEWKDKEFDQDFEMVKKDVEQNKGKVCKWITEFENGNVYMSILDYHFGLILSGKS